MEMRYTCGAGLAELPGAQRHSPVTCHRGDRAGGGHDRAITTIGSWCWNGWSPRNTYWMLPPSTDAKWPGRRTSPVDAAWPAGSAAHQRGLIDYISASANFASIRK